MFKKGGYLVLFLMMIVLSSSTDDHLTTQSNATKPIQQAIVSNTEGKEQPHNNSSSNPPPAIPSHNQTSNAPTNQHSTAQKPKEVLNKTFDKVQAKFQQQTLPSSKSESLDSFSQQVAASSNLNNSMTFNSQQPINEEWNEQTKHERQIEEQKRLEQQKEQAQQLYSWIADEMALKNTEEEGILSQSFQIALLSGDSYTFRWNPPKNQVLHLKILVLDFNPDDGSLVIMKENQKEEYIQVSYRNQGHLAYSQLGKVYVQRSFKFDFDTDYKYFKLTNNIGRNVIIMVDLEKLNEIVTMEGKLKNDHFAATASKLIAIDNEVSSGQKLREHSYKYQWGFLENQYTHDSRLLGLTGLQLLIIIAAAVVQVYFIKSLLDNRAIV